MTNEPAKEQQQRQGPAVAGGTASPNKDSVGLGCQKARESVLLFPADKQKSRISIVEKTDSVFLYAVGTPSQRLPLPRPTPSFVCQLPRFQQSKTEEGDE